MDPQILIEAKAFYRDKLRSIWIASLNEPSTVSNIRFWKQKSKQYAKRLHDLGNLDWDDTHLLFIIKCALYRLDEYLEVISRV